MDTTPLEKLLKGDPAPPRTGAEDSAGGAPRDRRAGRARLPTGRGVWAIGGGKGGVGKSLVTANVGILLAQLGHRVCLIDADLGGANLHSCLGIRQPSTTLDDFVTRTTTELQDLAVETAVPNLSLISGAGSMTDAANPKYQTKMRLIRNIRALDFDHVLLDLGGGTGYNTLDFFLSARHGVLVCLPEPTSIDNLYRFLRAAFARRLRDLDAELGVGSLMAAALAKQGGRGVPSPLELFERIRRIDPDRGGRLHEAMQRFQPSLVVNQVRNADDAGVGPQIALVARRFFGIDLRFAGYLQYDDTVWRAVRRRRPLLVEYPVSPLAGSLREIVQRILSP